MQKQSPPKHRHDGTSPLPLGMDWSPPPRKWNGKDSVWPHDYHTGWSYCVIIPSWVSLPKTRAADPVVLYRVQVGVQSLEGVTSKRGVLRRFNNFLNLFSDVKKAFPKKTIPPAPTKGIFRLKTRTHLEERRRCLGEWLTELLSDIDISRSEAVASFLELEAAARASFENDNRGPSGEYPDSNGKVSAHQSPPNSSSSTVVGGLSLASDYGSDTPYEASELGTASLGRDDSSEIAIDDLALDDDVSSPIENLMKNGLSNIDAGLFMGQTILEQLEGLPKHKAGSRYNNNLKDVHNGNTSKGSYLDKNGLVLVGHARQLSDESVASDASSLRGGEVSSSSLSNSVSNGSLDHSSAEVLNAIEIHSNPELHVSRDTLLLPKDQRHITNKVLSTMNQRLVTVKTDMEDLISRLNQEITLKDYFATMVKDLEVELETIKQKNIENIQQAILMETKKVTKMQWEMEELRYKSMEMEIKLKAKEGEVPFSVPIKKFTCEQKIVLEAELDSTKEQLKDVSKRYDELRGKSKADIKVLIKEVKSLRSTEDELRKELSQTLKQKFKTEELLRQERETRQNANAARRKLLSENRTLHCRLQDCSNNFSVEYINQIAEPSSLSNALDLLATSDDRLNLLLEQVNNNIVSDGKQNTTSMTDNDDDSIKVDEELRVILKNMFTENAKLRKQVNSYFQHCMKMRMSKEADVAEASSSSSSSQNTKFFEVVSPRGWKSFPKKLWKFTEDRSPLLREKVLS